MKLKKILSAIFAITIVTSVWCRQESSSDVAAIFHRFNRADYCTAVLPYDFSDITKLLEFGKSTKKDCNYAERVFRLSTRLVKGTRCVNAYAFNDLLSRLPGLLEHYFVVDARGMQSLLDMEKFDRFKESVNTLLFSRFLNDYQDFKNDPDDFLDQMSQDILQMVEKESNLEDLRSMLVRFLEVGLSKIAWHPDDQEQIWESVKKTSNDLSKLVEHNVIENVDDLDDSYWSLLYRFDFFLDSFGSTLPVEFYDIVQAEVTGRTLLLVDLEEQQDWLETKEDFLKRSLRTNKAKMLANKNGIITS